VFVNKAVDPGALVLAGPMAVPEVPWITVAGVLLAAAPAVVAPPPPPYAAAQPRPARERAEAAA
jgi:energy-coupling factor transport system permease protein